MSIGSSTDFRSQLGQVTFFSQQVHRGIQEQLGLDAAKKMVTDYTTGGDVVSVLSNFTTAVVKPRVHIFEFIKPSDQGSSGDDVYIGKNLSNEMPFVVFKIFKEGSKNFLAEVFSLQVLASADVSDFSCPKITEVGRCVLKNIHCFFICESVAPGRSLMSYYEKPTEFELLEKGVRKCGASLAKLHGRSSQFVKGLPEYLETKARENFAGALEKLTQQQQPGICLKKLRKLFESTLNMLNKDIFALGFTHGDISLKNVFYDCGTDKITWIDLPTLAKSIDTQNEPIGIVAKDFHQMIRDIKFRRVHYSINHKNEFCHNVYMTKEKTCQLVNAFYSGYISAHSFVPGRSQIDFFKLKSYSSAIVKSTVFDDDCPLAEPDRSNEVHRISTMFDDLRLMLNGAPPPQAKFRSYLF